MCTTQVWSPLEEYKEYKEWIGKYVNEQAGALDAYIGFFLSLNCIYF